ADDDRRRLREISRIMKESLCAEGLAVKGDAHIISWEIGDEKAAVEMSRELLVRDIFVVPVRYPTAPLGKAIIRIGMTALHTEEDVKFFLESLKGIRGKTGLINE
ncbi:MAG: aminotransferase class I/II-fold pyridoxal phosphate-dependent enzyme, partial [Syntrophales bacterium]|nr:aminotransferase class I/II-fold pyridoxal phosphate-dependent enzyme [Syntrophales bacterium]